MTPAGSLGGQVKQPAAHGAQALRQRHWVLYATQHQHCYCLPQPLLAECLCSEVERPTAQVLRHNGKCVGCFAQLGKEPILLQRTCAQRADCSNQRQALGWVLWQLQQQGQHRSALLGSLYKGRTSALRCCSQHCLHSTLFQNSSQLVFMCAHTVACLNPHINCSAQLQKR